jgi:hypothetical protein
MTGARTALAVLALPMPSLVGAAAAQSARASRKLDPHRVSRHLGSADRHRRNRRAHRARGLLIALVGALTVWSAGVPAARDGILVAAIVEKYAIGLLVFFGPIKRTLPMTAVALADGAFATVYLISLATT